MYVHTVYSIRSHYTPGQMQTRVARSVTNTIAVVSRVGTPCEPLTKLVPPSFTRAGLFAARSGFCRLAAIWAGIRGLGPGHVRGPNALLVRTPEGGWLNANHSRRGCGKGIPKTE